MKQGEFIAISAFMIIVIGVAMAVAGPNSYLGKAWNTFDQHQSQSIPAPAAGGSSVVGGPTLSAQQINNILCNAGSPACGTGQTFYNDSVAYNIDAAYALAFFHHESGFGTAGAAVQTRNVGNIVCTPGYNCIGRFRSYDSWNAGIHDWYRLIKEVYIPKGRTTVESIIPMYAPASDNNNESGYINAVLADVQSWRAA